MSIVMTQRLMGLLTELLACTHKDYQVHINTLAEAVKLMYRSPLRRPSLDDVHWPQEAVLVEVIVTST